MAFKQLFLDNAGRTMSPFGYFVRHDASAPGKVTRRIQLKEPSWITP